MSERVSDEMITDLRRLAQAASPGPWMTEPGEAYHGPEAAGILYVSTEASALDDDPPMFSTEPADARYIAAANPRAIEGLLDALETERERLRLANIDQANTEAELNAVNDRMAAVRALHSRCGCGSRSCCDSERCSRCDSLQYPCDTIRALDGDS